MFYRLLTCALLFALCSIPAFAATAEDMAAALDRADGLPEIARQADALDKASCSGQGGAKADCALARAYYLLGEGETDKGRRLSYFDRATGRADRALKLEPALVHALYWKCMAELQKADLAGGLKALRLVKDALRGFETVAAKDPLYDSAGAYRSSGKVLIDAPAWAFIGDKKKGMRLLEKAKELAPGCLINRLYLAQAYQKNGRDAEARAEAEYVMRAPVDEKNRKDDLEVKGEAGRLLAGM